MALAIKIQSPKILSPIFSLLQIYPTDLLTFVQKYSLVYTFCKIDLCMGIFININTRTCMKHLWKSTREKKYRVASDRGECLRKQEFGLEGLFTSHFCTYWVIFIVYIHELNF